MTRTSKRKNLPVIWWSVGFISALGVLFAVTLSLAGVVYTGLPKPARLDESFRKADVIVCLTGGRGRIRKALELYEKGYGRTLYISGTDRQVNMRDVLRELRWVGPVQEDKIILENISANTIQNAQQVSKFVSERRLGSVLLVTSSYHARRAYYVFQKVLPRDVHLDIAWFEQGPFDGAGWWKHPNGIWVTVSEFFKFFYAYLRLTSLAS